MLSKFSTFLTFLLVISISQAIDSTTSNSFRLPSRFLSYPYVTKDGSLTIQKDDQGFYVNVDFLNQQDQASDSEAYDPSLGAMSLSLFTSQTILAQSCFNFTDYCSIYGCSESTFLPNASLPYFVMEGYSTSAQVYLDYGNWVLNNEATIATLCDGSTSSFSGTSRYGILGLGYNTNFIGSSNIFSIWFDEQSSTGTLRFSENTDITSSPSSTYIGSLFTTSEWNIFASTVQVQLTSAPSNPLLFSVSAILDLNADAIGFPLSIYQDIMSLLENSTSLSCLNETYKPVCFYNGRIGDLPTLELTIQGIQIDLPPTLYVQGYDESDGSDEYAAVVSLNFKALSSSLEGENYVTEYYENYIILDQNFMTYYYTEFVTSSENYQVAFYRYNSNSNPDSQVIWPFIVAGVLGFILLVCLIRCCVNKRKKRLRNKRKPRTQQEESLIDSSAIPEQVPHRHEVQPVPVQYNPQNYPPYQYNNYNPGNYGYPQFPPQHYPYANNNFNNLQTGPYPYLPPPPSGQINRP